ncbi:hypothetical protein PR202_ga09912 [Eleusine coracana subsp. coracana]|uniref:Uncharacterized protein n=1 Tax=Eleusine coracana subsp. coracana TaxID=191504 RepID=A0AAV5C5H3_ELECO|nr:hypothetical protein PR202_ga09912 [Eleusine coracana subsp. coracana]
MVMTRGDGAPAPAPPSLHLELRLRAGPRPLLPSVDPRPARAPPTSSTHRREELALVRRRHPDADLASPRPPCSSSSAAGAGTSSSPSTSTDASFSPSASTDASFSSLRSVARVGGGNGARARQIWRPPLLR